MSDDLFRIPTITEQKIELVTMPYACFSVQLHEITLNAIQQVLKEAYLELSVDPQYLFCSKRDSEKVDAEIERCINQCHVHADSVRLPNTRLVNQITGKLMHIVIMPELEDGTLIFGFFTY